MQTRFATEYLVDLNATQAAIRAGYSEKTARQIGSELLKTPLIEAAITQAMEARNARVERTADDLISHLWDIVLGDANEFSQHRRVCCRYCYGENNRYQYTAREFEEIEEQVAEYNLKRKEEEPEKCANPRGGIGFDPRRDPNPDCPDCFGEGVSKVFFADTRKVSARAKSSYAGVKKTRDGMEIIRADREVALDKLMRHLGKYDDKTTVKYDLSNLTNEELLALEQLQKKMGV